MVEVIFNIKFILIILNGGLEGKDNILGIGLMLKNINLEINKVI